MIAGKASWGVLAVIIFLGFILAWQLASQNAGSPLQEIELTDVVHDECFSPNGDGVKDVMGFSAVFQGPPGKRVYAVLFDKKRRINGSTSRSAGRYSQQRARPKSA